MSFYKRYTPLPVIAASLILSSPTKASTVEELSGLYDLQCDSATLLLDVGYGTGSPGATAGTIIAEGESFTYEAPTTCESGDLQADESAFYSSIFEHCEANLVIPDEWGFGCNEFADSLTEVYSSAVNGLNGYIIDTVQADIQPPPNWFYRWLNLRPTATEITYNSGHVSNSDTTTFSGERFATAFHGTNFPFPLFEADCALTSSESGWAHVYSDSPDYMDVDQDNAAALSCSYSNNDRIIGIYMKASLNQQLSGNKVSE